MIEYVRPVLTLVALMSWVGMILGQVPYPDKFEWVVIGMVTWWFGDRTITKLRCK